MQKKRNRFFQNSKVYQYLKLARLAGYIGQDVGNCLVINSSWFEQEFLLDLPEKLFDGTKKWSTGNF